MWIVTAALTATVLAGTAGALGAWSATTWLRYHRYHQHKDVPAPDAPTWRERVGAWVHEGAAVLELAAAKLTRTPPVLADGEGPPVLCVHGFTQDGTNFAALRERLTALGRPSAALDLGLPGRAVHQYTRRLVEGLEEVVARFPDRPVDVVAHSMGGVLLRQALRDRPDLGARLRTIVTLGSPHRGTAAARGPVRWWPEGGALHRASAWLRELPGFADLAPAARAVTVGGTADYVVYPLDTCHLPGSERVDLPGLGHAGLLTHPRALRRVVEVLSP